jgi:hypothetical protein
MKRAILGQSLPEFCLAYQRVPLFNEPSLGGFSRVRDPMQKHRDNRTPNQQEGKQQWRRNEHKTFKTLFSIMSVRAKFLSQFF